MCYAKITIKVHHQWKTSSVLEINTDVGNFASECHCFRLGHMMSLHVDKQVAVTILKTIIILGAYQKETSNTDALNRFAFLQN